ncbi:putative membrane protein, partial [Bordetella avium 197N]
VQRFQRDPLPQGTSTDEMARFFEERVAVLERHFPPSVAQVYALPRLGSDASLEWWTSQEGAVTPFASLNETQQKALLARHAEHQAQLQSLARSLDARGMAPQANLVRSLQSRADPASMFSVEGHLLLTQGMPAPAAAPPSRRRWLWIALPLFLLLLLLALLCWWLWMRPAVPVPPAQTVPPAQIAPEPAAPPAKAEPDDKNWPTELVIVLDTSAAMNERAGQGSPSRAELASREIERLSQGLPSKTTAHLVRYGGGECRAPTYQGPFPASDRGQMLSAVKQSDNGGKASLGASLRRAAEAVDGKSRDALIFVFAGGPDRCDEDVCAVARELHAKQPRLRINQVDLTGQKNLDPCVAQETQGNAYTWGDHKGQSVDLSAEARKLLDAK